MPTLIGRTPKLIMRAERTGSRLAATGAGGNSDARPRPNRASTARKIFGVRPGSPFLFTIPATGERPMKFSADNLPRGLKLDRQDRTHHRQIEKDG